MAPLHTNLCTWKMEAGESRIQYQPQVYRSSKLVGGYLKLKNEQEKEKDEKIDKRNKWNVTYIEVSEYLKKN